MIITKNKLAITAAASMLALGSCSTSQMLKMAQEQEIVVTPSPLELHGDSVKFTLSATLPTNMLKKKKLYTIKTNYKYGDPSEEFEQIEFSNTEFQNQDIEQPSLTENFSFLYKDEMKTGTVTIQGIVSNLEKTKFKETPELEVAKGVITTSRLVKNSVYTSFADHGYNNKEELVPTYVDFHFQKGSAKLRSSEVRGENGLKLDAFIASKLVTRTVTITGSHSPEGLESINSDLAEERATVINNFYFDRMKRYDYKNLADSIKFVKKVIFQDWKPFLAELEKNTTISTEQKNEIKQIVSSSTNFTATEKQLHKLSSYKKLMSDIYPDLRFSKTEIWSVKEKKTDAEISILAKGIVDDNVSKDTLSPEELLYSATLTPLSNEKEAIYKVAVRYNDSWEANNNLGAINLEKAIKSFDAAATKSLLETALIQFDLSIKKQSSAEALNNKAATLLLLGKQKEAILAYNKASTAKSTDENVSKGIAAGLGTIYIKQGDYPSAISSLVNASDIKNGIYNLGLAYLLSKDFTKAEETLENAVYVNKEDALAYYLLAIVGVRSNNTELVSINMMEAIKLDPELREKALGDLEFAAIKETPAFTEAIK
jgi:tetratricopeptide (TPR) repeat protein